MGTYDAIRELPVIVDGYELSGSRLEVADGFVRETTTVRLYGGDEQGLGEDLSYEPQVHERLRKGGEKLPLAGRFTLEGFSRRLTELDLAGALGVGCEKDRRYRTWAIESAALDLALRQANLALGAALGRVPRPTSFVVSLGLGDPPTLERVHAIVAKLPGLRFKVDARSDWTEEILDGLVGLVSCVDLKGHYHGQTIYQAPDEQLYAQVTEAFPDAWIEDAAESSATRAIVQANWRRLAWDAPILSVSDIEALPSEPAAINVKPSRFGALRKLFDVYDHCSLRGIHVYGGGEFELGVGRRQIQHLASLFHPDAANDVAPAAFNEERLLSVLPGSPLPSRGSDAPGF